MRKQLTHVNWVAFSLSWCPLFFVSICNNIQYGCTCILLKCYDAKWRIQWIHTSTNIERERRWIKKKKPLEIHTIDLCALCIVHDFIKIKYMRTERWVESGKKTSVHGWMQCSMIVCVILQLQIIIIKWRSGGTSCETVVALATHSHIFCQVLCVYLVCCLWCNFHHDACCAHMCAWIRRTINGLSIEHRI